MNTPLPPDLLDRKVRSIKDWNNLTDDEAKRLTPEDTVRWIDAYEVQRKRDQRKQAAVDGVKGWLQFVCQIVILGPVSLALLCLGVELIALIFSGLDGRPFTLTDVESGLLHKSVWTLLLLGPIAYKARNYLNP